MPGLPMWSRISKMCGSLCKWKSDILIIIKKFRCIAGECPDTCCAGWEIPVDAASEKRYREARKSGVIRDSEFARKLKKYVKHGQIISKSETCPFLNHEGLCEMYIELGPDSLCHTCARHPRHLEDYGNIHEMVLLLSCPEVARLVLAENDGGFNVRQMLERQENMDGIDEELLDVLLAVRELIWKWAATREDSQHENPKMSLDECMMCSVALAHDVQRRLAKHDDTGVKMVVRRYDVPDVAEKFVAQWGRKNRENSESCRMALYHSGDSHENDIVDRKQILEERPELEQDMRKVFEYFVYSFLLSALYDGDLLTKMKMAVLCTILLVFWCIDKLQGVKDPNFMIVESARAEATGYSFPSGHIKQ